MVCDGTESSVSLSARLQSKCDFVGGRYGLLRLGRMASSETTEVEKKMEVELRL